MLDGSPGGVSLHPSASPDYLPPPFSTFGWLIFPPMAPTEVTCSGPLICVPGSRKVRLTLPALSMVRRVLFSQFQPPHPAPLISLIKLPPLGKTILFCFLLPCVLYQGCSQQSFHAELESLASVALFSFSVELRTFPIRF